MVNPLSRFREYLDSHKCKAEVIVRFLKTGFIQFLTMAAFFQIFLGGVDNYFSPSVTSVIGGIKGLPVWGFGGLMVVMLNKWREDDKIRKQVDLAYLHLSALALAALYLALIPENVVVPERNFIAQSFIFLPMLTLMVSPVCLFMNVLWALSKR